MRDVDRTHLKLKPLLAAVVAGAAMLALVQYVMLPKLARDLAPAQRIWLRNAFLTHSVWVLFAIVALTAVFSLPVLFLSLWIMRRRP
jgi:uncharacterized membrane-anchored protein